MAEDIANLLPLLEEKGGIYNVCDSYQLTFGEISASVTKQLGKHKPISIPYWMAWCMAKVGDLLGSKAPINSYKIEKMTKSLTFSNEKARQELGWEPLDVLENYKVFLWIFQMILKGGKHPINDVYQDCYGVATFASNTKSHDDKGRGRSGDCLLRREQDQLQTALVGTWD